MLKPIVKYEDPAKYYTVRDHLFVLTGPSGAGQTTIARILDEQNIAGLEIIHNLKSGVTGIKTVITNPANIDVLRAIIPDGHMTIIYINSPEDRRYSRLSYQEHKTPSEIRGIYTFDDGVYRCCRVDYVVNDQETIYDTAELVKQIITNVIGGGNP